MNRVILMGRLTRDPELRASNDLTISKFTVAVDRKGGKNTDFIPCVAFGKTAEFVNSYFKQGSRILVEGRIQVSKYDSNGQTKSFTEVAVDSVEFCESKKAEKSDEFVDPLNDEGLPFG